MCSRCTARTRAHSRCRASTSTGETSATRGPIGAAMHGVDGVLHLAGMMGVWRPMEDYRAVNVTGTENVCRAALAAGARVVHVSSWTVYGMGLGRTGSSRTAP